MSADGVPRTISLEVPPVPFAIAVARSTVRRTVAFRDDDAVSSFLIALTEILGNAIDEHLRVGSNESIVMTIESGERDVVSVRDVGAGFDPATTPTSDADSDRGRGIALARAFVPELELDSGPGGTFATLPLDGIGIVR